MFSLRHKSRFIVLLLLMLVGWMALGGIALGQEDEMDVLSGETVEGGAVDSAKGAGPVWAIAYIVVIVLVSAGIFATVRSSKRRDRDKPEQYKATIQA
jgi:hypothetical protein